MTTSQMLRLLFATLLALSILPAQAQEDRRKPPTKVTEKLSPQVYEKILAAQTLMEGKDMAGAEAAINELLVDRDSRNDYELSQIYNFLAAIHYEQGRIDDTIRDYLNIVALAEAPEQVRTNALFRLAQLYFVEGQYERSVKVLERWMTQVESVRPEAHMLMAQAYYQMEQYDQAKAPIISALREAKRRQQAPAESWLALLRAVYYELGDYRNAVKVLAQMVKRWPNPSYYKQLSGMLGLMEQQKGQLYVMHAAAVGDMLETEFEILNLARLYMAEDAPYPAVDVLQSAMKAGLVEESAANLQLLAQAMSLAKDPEGQIPVLKKAAALSGEAKDYMYLGQAQLALYQWAEAAESLERAVRIGGLERPGSVYMQIGTAYYNLKRYSRARQAFKEAGQYPDFAQQSAQWVRFIESEVARDQAMRAG